MMAGVELLSALTDADAVVVPGSMLMLGRC